MGTIELTRLTTRTAPAVEIATVQVILHNSVRPTVSDPKELIGRNQMCIWRRPDSRVPHVEELSVLVENLDPSVTTINDEQPPIIADLNAMNRIEFIWTWILRIFWSAAPVHQELAVFVELRDARTPVAIADEERSVGQPRDVCRPVKQLSCIAAALALCTERHHELTVVGEFVNHMELIINDPHVLLGIVRTHFDFVWSAPAGHLEHLVEIRP